MKPENQELMLALSTLDIELALLLVVRGSWSQRRQPEMLGLAFSVKNQFSSVRKSATWSTLGDGSVRVSVYFVRKHWSRFRSSFAYSMDLLAI